MDLGCSEQTAQGDAVGLTNQQGRVLPALCRAAALPCPTAERHAINNLWQQHNRCYSLTCAALHSRRWIKLNHRVYPSNRNSSFANSGNLNIHHHCLQKVKHILEQDHTWRQSWLSNSNWANLAIDSLSYLLHFTACTRPLQDQILIVHLQVLYQPLDLGYDIANVKLIYKP